MIADYRKYITLPNIITLSRVFLIPFFVVFSYKGLTSDFPSIYFAVSIALLVFVLIRVTDLLDGWIARSTNCVSVLGSYLDVWTDFLFVLCSYTMLNFLNIIPYWLTALAIYKFFEFLILSEVIKRKLVKIDLQFEGINNKTVLYYDLPGRIISALFYLMPSLVLIFRLLCIDLDLVNTLCFGLLIFTAFSSVYKFIIVKENIDLLNRQLYCKFSSLSNLRSNTNIPLVSLYNIINNRKA